MFCNNGCGCSKDSCSVKLSVTRSHRILFSVMMSMLGMVVLSVYLFLNKTLETFKYSFVLGLVLLAVITVGLGLLFAFIPINFLCCPGRILMLGVCWGLIAYSLFDFIVKLIDNNYSQQIPLLGFILYGLITAIGTLMMYFMCHCHSSKCSR